MRKLLIVILVLMLIPNLVFAETTTTDLESLRNQINQYQQQEKGIQAKIDDLNSQIKKLDTEVEEVSSKQNKVQAQIEDKELEIDKTLYELHKTNIKLEENKNNFNEYVRNAYKHGNNAAVEVLFSAKSFGDLIDKIEAVNLINRINQNIINQIESNKETIKKKAVALKEEKSELDNLNSELEINKDKLNYSRMNISSLVDQAIDLQKNTIYKLQATQQQYNEVSQYSGGSIPHNESDEMLLARLIESEAGAESYLGKIAVASVVINRAKINNETIPNIIYAKNQFDGVGTNNFKKEPSDESKRASKEVLGGKNVVPNAYYYANLNLCAPSFAIVSKFVIRIGNHWFFKM